MSIKTAILKNHDQLEKNTEDIISYGIELIGKKSDFLRAEKKAIIVEGLLLRACAHWEKFLEAEIVYLVEIDQKKLRDELELPSTPRLNRRTVRAILFSNSFRSFHDIERSKGFFRTFISDDYNLFNELSKEQIRETQMVYKLRNYLAHYSEFAKKKLQQEYEETYGYSRFMQPGRFLMKKNGEHFEYLIHNFSLMSAKMRRGLK